MPKYLAHLVHIKQYHKLFLQKKRNLYFCLLCSNWAKTSIQFKTFIRWTILQNCTKQTNKWTKTANLIYSRYLIKVSSSWPDMPCVMEWPWFRISRAKMFWLLLPQWNTPIPTLKTTVSRSAAATVAQCSRNENYIWKNQTYFYII